MVAILSGDIIESGSKGKETDWFYALKSTLSSIGENYELLGSGAQIFRGDGFQLGLKDPSLALRIAVLIRAGLIRNDKLDARLAIGIGEADSIKENILESDGEAFRLSGRLLDELKNEKSRLAFSSPVKTINDEMGVSLKLLGVIIDNWSQTDAETVWLSWLEGLTPKQIQQELGISQPAVSKRKSSARMDEIQLLIDRFETLISEL